MKRIALVLACLCLYGATAQAQGDKEVQVTAPDTFERVARREAAKQGWPGYPDAYQDAFVAGARWANARKKALTCSDAFTLAE